MSDGAAFLRELEQRVPDLKLLTEEIDRGILVALDVDAPNLQSRTGIVFAKNRLMPPAAEALVAELIRESENLVSAGRR